MANLPVEPDDNTESNQSDDAPVQSPETAAPGSQFNVPNPTESAEDDSE